MKKKYVAPVMECEEFVANEYVAACYSIKCVTPTVTGNNQMFQYLINDTNENGIWDGFTELDCIYDIDDHPDEDGFVGCSEYHDAQFDELPSANGFVIQGYETTEGNWWLYEDAEAYPVYWWYGASGDDKPFHVSYLESDNAIMRSSNATS